jgi:potassium-transporting ATPase potassium-binding subunit
MTASGWVEILFYCVVLLALTKPLGLYMVRVYDGSMTWLGWIERLIYRVCGIDPNEDQYWTRYGAALLLFSLAGMLLTYLVLRLQAVLPLNPARLPAVTDRQSFETAASFTTNTNWQSYGGEMTMSYFSQMTQLAFHNFVSAAAGMAAVIAMIRGIVRNGTEAKGRIGNFWADLVRTTLYILLPLSVVVTLLIVHQGVIQNFRAYLEVTTLEGAKQVIAMGPAASQIAIKQLGTNGGGFFNMNSAHPFENPTPWSNFIEMFSILILSSALTWTFGRMVKKQVHGWAVWAAMFVLFFGGTAMTYWSEGRGDPIHAARGIDIVASSVNPGGNMEGKEVRHGIANSALWAVATTDASNGSVNAMHDSFTPLGGLVPIINMQLGEVVFGGVGSGLYGMIVMAVLTVFIAGLMVGRTPEYLGKKIQAREIQVVMLYVLIFPAIILIPTAVSVLLPAGLKGLNNTGPHGLSEILYAFTSTGANNGSAFAGLTGSTYYYNTLLGLNTLLGRFAMMVPMLALGGFLAEKRLVPESPGTFPVTTPIFVVLLVSVILIVGALTFFPVLSLGPIVEHLLMGAGRVF